MDELMLNRIKAESVELLCYFDDFCKKNGIEYSVSFGTELGAVRHKGFIPWDDDIDVDMHWDEFVKFQKAWMAEGDTATYFLQTKETDLYISSIFPRIRKNETACITKGFENRPIHWGLPLDIFPVFNTPKFVLGRGIQTLFYKAASVCCVYNWNHVNANKVILHLSRHMTLFFFKGVCIISTFSRKSGQVYYPYGYHGKKVTRKSIFFPSKPIMFENRELMGHADPDAYLSWQYGDYMTPPPENKRGGHGDGIFDLDHDYSMYTGVKVQK